MKKKGSHFAHLLILSAFLLVSGCKKNSAPTVSIQVKDAITGSNVSNANVGIHRCTIYQFLCGLIPYRSGITGNDGNCSFLQQEYNEAKSITVSQNSYWSAFEPITNRINLYPDGWLKLRIIKGASYPADSRLMVAVSYSNQSNGLTVNPATDSTILLRCYGGASNNINWRVDSSNGSHISTGSFFQNVTRHDTVSYTLNY